MKHKGFFGRVLDEYRYYTMKRWDYKDVGDFWDTVKDYDEIDDETYAYNRRFHDSIRMCTIPDKSKILDIDCRTGNGTVFYHSRGKVEEAVCVSPSPCFLEVCKKRMKKYKIKARTLLLRSLPLPIKDKSFDAVLCMETIEHISNHIEFLRELNMLLKDDGELVLTTPNVIWEPVHWFVAIFNIHHSEGPHRFIRRKRILNFLRRAGFKVEKERTTILIPAGARWLTNLGYVIERAMGERLRRIFCLRRIFICKKIK
jgi:SAM-dependent methyltransferase